MKRIALAVALCLTLFVSTASALSPDVIWPKATGKSILSDGALTIDSGGAENGYIMVKAGKSAARYRLRVACGAMTMTYNLNGKGSYESIPLQMGDGQYEISLYRSMDGKRYAKAGFLTVDAALRDPYAPFLVPNQMVSYTERSTAVALSDQICVGKKTDSERFEAIRSYIRTYFSYDYVKAYTSEPDAMPAIEECAGKKSGAYQDLAATVACMLRVQGIPTKMILGYTEAQAHAWNVVVIDGKEILYDPSAELGCAVGSIYSVERTY